MLYLCWVSSSAVFPCMCVVELYVRVNVVVEQYVNIANQPEVVFT